MERIICQCCGEALRKHGDVYVCGYCGATYRDDQVEKAADLLKGLLDDFKIEQLSNARRRLYETTHEKYPSSQAVTQAAGNVLSISPDDFMARMYLHSHDSDPHELISLLSRGNVSEWEAKETVDWLVRSLDFRVVGAVKDFADRHLKGAEKTNALNEIEDEAFKLDSGVYDLSLKRDVFLCYSTEDMPRVIEIMETFEENGLSCFAAFRNLRHGKGAQENYQDAIFRAMRNCRVFVFLSSNSSRDPNRKGVAEELDHLVSDLPKKPRVEFLLEDYPERMPILAKRRMAQAFPHLEYCRDVEDLVVRVSGLLDAEENAEKDRVKKIAEEASERAKKELQAEFEAREAARKEELARELEERLRVEKEKLEAQKESSAFPPAGGAMDAESMLAMMERAEELKRRKAGEVADRKKAEPVVGAIKAIGAVEYSPTCKARIDVARKAYDALTTDQRAYVHHADVLLTAEREYGEAEEAADRKKAEAAIDAIEAIGSVECSPTCKARIDAARKAYDALTTEQRAFVHNADALSVAEREYGEAETAATKRAIEAIGTVEYSPKCKARIDEAQRLYDALTTEQRAFVHNTEILQRASQEFAKLGEEAAKPIEAIFDMRILRNGGASVARCLDKKITEAAIPELYRGKAVTSIGWGAFGYCYDLKSVTIPSSVTSVGENAFQFCSSLTSIAIPSSVTSIGEEAFQFCSSLKSITIPESVVSIGGRAFFECSSLTLIAIPSSVTTIGNGAFYNCSSLKSIKVDPSNPKFDSRSGCNAIIETETNALLLGCANTVIPESVTSIGNGALSGCKSLTSIAIPDGVTEIGRDAFQNCSTLSSINIPSSVTSIGEDAFLGCAFLTSIAIPGSVTAIAGGAFFRCLCLSSITIPSSVTSIGRGAFGCCSSLKSITIPSGVTSIGEEAFSRCKSLASITIPSGVTSIGVRAFEDCSSLKSIAIPSSVASIDKEAFSGCSCEIHFAHKKPLFGYPKGFPEDCLKGFKGKVFWGGK